MYRNETTGHEHDDLSVIAAAASKGDVIAYDGVPFVVVTSANRLDFIRPVKKAVTTTGKNRHGQRIYRDTSAVAVYAYVGEEDFVPADETAGRPAQSRIFVKHPLHEGSVVPTLIVKGSMRDVAQVTA